MLVEKFLNISCVMTFGYKSSSCSIFNSYVNKVGKWFVVVRTKNYIWKILIVKASSNNNISN